MFRRPRSKAYMIGSEQCCNLCFDLINPLSTCVLMVVKPREFEVWIKHNRSTINRGTVGVLVVLIELDPREVHAYSKV